MATLEIRKKSLKTWLHVPSDADNFILSKFYCKTDAGTFKIVEESGSNRREYSYTNITVYDDTDIGTPETFESSQALMLRLEVLKYTGFNWDGDIPTSYIESVVAGTNVTIDNTDPLNPIISSTGGGGTQNLNEVLVEGNTTSGENISISSGDAIILDNASTLRKGTIDAGYGGSKGIAQICAVGYELKWEAGRLYVMGDGGTTIREVSHNFTTTPTVYDDITKGFVIGSRWLLDNGTLYVCTDATDDSAVWELQLIDLQYVTNNGNSTTNSLNVQLGDEYTNIYTSNVYTANDANNSYAFIDNNGTIAVNSGDFEGTIQANNLSANNVNLEFPQKAVGSYTIATTSDIPTKTSDLINDGDNGTSHFISLEDLPSTLTVYPTTVASGIGGYNKLVSSITDPDYNTTAVDVSTGAITGTNQLIAGLITDENQIIGNPGVFNMSTIGNIRRTGGSGQAEFFFRVYKRDSGGTETLILQSNNTQQITTAIYAEFFANGLWNYGIFVSTDRIVIKFYGTKVGSGSNPTYDFQFGGTSPVRSIIPVPLNVIPSGGVPLTREEFSYTISQDFTLSGTVSFIYAVFVNGQELNSSQYSFITTTLTIADTLQSGDKINILYTPTSSGFLEYYTKAEVDAITIATTSPLTGGGDLSANRTISIPMADADYDGYLSSSAFNNFTSKQDPITLTTNNFSGAATFSSGTLNIPNYDGFISKLRGHETFRGVNYSNNSTTEVTSGGITIATTGSTIARSVSSTNYASKQVRKGFYGSVVSTGRYTGTRGSALLWYLGGGFKYVCDVFISDTAFGSGCRQFYGMAGQTTDLNYSDSVLVSSLTNIIGVGSDAADTNLQVFYNDATGTATKIDLGANFPANRTAGAALTTVYSIELFNDSSSTEVKYCVKNKETGAVVIGTINTNLPLHTQGLNFFASRCMGAGITNTGQFDLLTLGVYSL
jgi:hypothetical protein